MYKEREREREREERVRERERERDIYIYIYIYIDKVLCGPIMKWVDLQLEEGIGLWAFLVLGVARAQ